MKKQVYAAVLAFVLGSCLVTLDAQGSFWTLVNGRLQTRNPVGFSNGTAAAPAISFTNDTNSGFYSVSDNVVGVAGNAVLRFVFSNSNFTARSDGTIGFSSTTDPSAGADTTISRVAAGEFGWTAVLFANLGTPANGTFAYCSDCAIANPCTGSGTGALAKRLNGVWVCN